MKPWSEMHVRDRDAMVAEKVFGHTVIREKRPGGNVFINQVGNVLPGYTTSILSAWEVANNIHERGLSMVVKQWAYPESKWIAEIGAEFVAECDTAPEVICLAALRTVGMEV